MGRFDRCVLAAGIVLGLAACASKPPQPPSPPPDPYAACLATLDADHVQYRRVKDWTTPEGCGISGAVEIQRSAIPWNRNTQMSCPLATSIWTFETSVVQPAAKRYLNRTVAKMNNFGAYSCRAVNGGHKGRLSQHALGQAIDISGFELDDGTRLTILKDWRDPGPKGEFLRSVAKGACSIFAVVLSPNHDALHRDHIHVDIGPYKLCGT